MERVGIKIDMLEDRICLSPYLKVLRTNSNGTVNVMNFITSMAHIIDKTVWERLTGIKKSVSKSDMVELMGLHIFDEYIKNKILVWENRKWLMHQPRFIEIETINYCNWRCVFCPNSLYKRDKEIMPMSLFEHIMQSAVDYGHIKFISLHGYSEPTIDPFFIERVKLIKKSGFQLVLYTNGSGLTRSVLRQLKDVNVTRNIVVNIPSSNQQSFIQKTGAYNLDRVVDNIHNAQQMGFRVNISLQGTVQEQADEIEGVTALFPDTAIATIPSFDRAGILKNQYHHHKMNVENRLSGCSFILTDIHIDVKGRYYLCLEDYFTNYTFGYVKENTFKEFLESDKYINMIKQIWGGIPAQKNLICRKCILLMDSSSKNPM